MKIENIETLKQLVEKKEDLEFAILIHKRLIEKKMPLFISEARGGDSYKKEILRNWNNYTKSLIGEEQEILFAKKVYEMAIRELEIELKATIERIESLD